MKKSIKVVSIVLSALIVFTVFPVLSSGALIWLPRGDANGDSHVTLKDATAVQKYLAGTAALDPTRRIVADVNGDDNVTLKDATLIQKYVAGLINKFPVEDVFIDVFRVDEFYSNYSSGLAVAGLPVVFNAKAEGGIAPYTYEFFVDGISVQSASSNSTFTLDKPVGTYDVKVVITDKRECTVQSVFNDFQVSKPYEYIEECPPIMALTLYQCNPHHQHDLVAFASVYYQYKYVQYKFELYNNDGELIKSRDYALDNEFQIGKLNVGNYTLKVYSNDFTFGFEPNEESIQFTVDWRPLG